jgi:8-oxo-dGTP diphosphatase
VAQSGPPERESWPRPSLTVDVVLLSGDPAASVLLIERGHDPCAGAWALPGGFVDQGERVYQAALRELQEETGIAAGPLTLLGVYDTPGRDPRGWTISVTYIHRVTEQLDAVGGDDASAARWFGLDELPELAFDHATIIADAKAAAVSCALTSLQT